MLCAPLLIGWKDTEDFHRFWDGSRAVTAHQTASLEEKEAYARVWDLASGRQIGSLRHGGTVSCIAFSQDGTKIVTGSYDRTAQVWDAEKLVPLGRPFLHENHLEDVDISPDGKRIATATAVRTGHIWDLETRQAVGQPLQHRAGLRSIAFCPDPNRPLVLTGSLDHTARLWDVETGKPIGPPLQHEDEVWSVNFSPDGSKVLVDGQRIWPIPPPALEGVLERVDLWLELITGMKLDINSGGVINVLDAPAWRSRRQRLDELGGPPME